MDFSFPRLQTLFPTQESLAKIPFKIRLISLITLFALCWTLWCYHALSSYHKLQSLSAEITILSAKAQKLEKQKLLYQKIQKQMACASPDYLSQVVETMPLLEAEKKRVAKLAKQFPENPSLKERALFLDSGQNQILFEDLQFSHRAQMDASDLRKFLETVEGDPYDRTTGKPFLLIKKFDLLKCYEKGDEKVYSIHVELQ